MNEYVGLFLMVLLWLSLSYLFFRILKRKFKRKPFDIDKAIDSQQGDTLINLTKRPHYF